MHTKENQDTQPSPGFSTANSSSEMVPLFTDESGEPWRDALDLAILSTNEPEMWRIVGEQPNPEDAHDALATKVSRLAYAKDGQNVFCEMFMLPIVTKADCPVLGKEVWKSVKTTMRQTLQPWFKPRTQLTIYEQVLPLDWVSSWRPKVIRAHLHRLVPGQHSTKAEFETTEVKLPDHAPRLGFVVLACSSTEGWPEVAQLHSLTEKRNRDVIKFSMQVAANPNNRVMPSAPIVLSPDILQHAMTDGITTWLLELHEVVPITGWALVTELASPDSVQIALRLDDPTVQRTRFNIRLHQIGLQGLTGIVSTLLGIAPNMETPYDMTPVQYKEQVELLFDND